MNQASSKIQLESFREALEQGRSLKDLRDISSRSLEGIYSIAYNLYQQSHFERAERLFALLCIYDHRNPRYVQGLVAARKSMKAYESTAQACALWINLMPEDPAPWLIAADCSLALGKHKAALFGLREALHRNWKKHDEAAVQAQKLWTRISSMHHAHDTETQEAT